LSNYEEELLLLTQATI